MSVTVLFSKTLVHSSCKWQRFDVAYKNQSPSNLGNTVGPRIVLVLHSENVVGSIAGPAGAFLYGVCILLVSVLVSPGCSRPYH